MKNPDLDRITGINFREAIQLLQFGLYKLCKGIMVKKFKYFSAIVIILLGFFMTGNEVFAQDKGKPVVRSIAFYTIGGGVLGACVGVAYWMLDPLAPSADLRGSVMQGYGGGVFLGFIFGVLQLNKQAVFPYSDPEFPNEFNGNVQNMPFEGNSYHIVDRRTKSRSPQLPLFQFQYKF